MTGFNWERWSRAFVVRDDRGDPRTAARDELVTEGLLVRDGRLPLADDRRRDHLGRAHELDAVR
jgi:hypothetical protein